jgi:hypothetical protein
MSIEDPKRDRRSTRLSIAIPVTISGVDADGNSYSESVRTVIINKHGGRIATTRHLNMGAEVLIENRAMGAVAKANVAWLNEEHRAGDLHNVGLRLTEAQNIWGVAFPPDDWIAENGEEEASEPRRPAPPEKPTPSGEWASVSSLAGDEISIRVLHELQEAADAYTQDFQTRVKQLVQRLGLELEFELRDRAATTKGRELGAMEEQIRVLREGLSSTKEEIAKLEVRMRELKADLQSTHVPPSPAKEAHRQLTALSNSIVESMNKAAEEGLREYKNLLQKENQECTAKPRSAASQNQPLPPTPSSKH